MQLILAFAELGLGVLLLASGVTNASFADVIRGKAQLTSAPSTSGTAAAAAAPSGLSGSLTATVDQIAAAKGWSSSQVAAWLNVINRESGGSMTATNPSSGAYGIAQFINGPSEYATYGGDFNTLEGQLTAMANYIEQRYGTPAAAWAHELSAGWY